MRWAERIASPSAIPGTDPLAHALSDFCVPWSDSNASTRPASSQTVESFRSRPRARASFSDGRGLQSLGQTHALFLEWHSLQQIRKAGRFSDENGNSGSRPHTPAPLEAECLEIFETGSILVSSLGFPLFDSVARSSDQETEPSVEDNCFLLQAHKEGIDGRGVYTSEGFVVFAGSYASDSNAPSIGEASARARQRLIDTNVMADNGQGQLVFKRDHLFSSPSSAATAVLGRSANGWTEWKDRHGRTLHQVKREQGT